MYTMRWQVTLCLTTAFIAVISSEFTVLENTIENNLEKNHELNISDENTTSLDNDPVQNHTSASEANTPEEDSNEVTTTTEDNLTKEDISHEHTTATVEVECEKVSVEELEYKTTSTPEGDLFSETADIRSSSEDLIDMVPEVPYLIDTTSGPVRGRQWHEHENIISFIDIPYGTFEEPFQAPELAEPTTNTYDNIEHNKRCPQLDKDEYVGDTDCLTLSIFAPPNVDNVSVLFHIHDGSFSYGSGDPAIYGPEYLVPQGIILVLPNYRLGPLGFLCQQNDKAPGNAGLKDLTLALNWTQKNIDNFGGNPFNIIVSGEGMSGALAGYLALSHMSNQYINKVIIESGSLLSYWALDRYPQIHVEELTNKLGQGIHDVDIETLLTAAKGIKFKPCLEHSTEAFMVETPWTIINSENFNITFMIGVAMYAGIHEALQSEDSIKQFNEDYGLLLPNDLVFKNDRERTEVGKKVKIQYFGEKEISSNDIQELALCFTDAFYLSPGLRSARSLVAAGATVYVYEFSFVGEFNRELISINKPVDGAVRSDIIGYLFTQDGQVPHEETNEEQMIKVLVELWTNFMQTGNPSSESIVWNKLNQTSNYEEEWLLIGKELKVERGIHLDRMKLWTEIYEGHFIEHSLAEEQSSSAYVVLAAQLVFWVGFFRNISHFT